MGAVASLPCSEKGHLCASWGRWPRHGQHQQHRLQHDPLLSRRRDGVVVAGLTRPISRRLQAALAGSTPSGLSSRSTFRPRATARRRRRGASTVFGRIHVLCTMPASAGGAADDQVRGMTALSVNLAASSREVRSLRRSSRRGRVATSSYRLDGGIVPPQASPLLHRQICGAGLQRSLRAALAPRGIGVSRLYPGRRTPCSGPRGRRSAPEGGREIPAPALGGDASDGSDRGGCSRRRRHPREPIAIPDPCRFLGGFGIGTGRSGDFRRTRRSRKAARN
jgi:hypothetical protein